MAFVLPYNYTLKVRMLDSYCLVKSKTYFHIYFILMIINKMGCDSLSAYLMASLFQFSAFFFEVWFWVPSPLGLGIEPRVSHMLGKHSSTDPHLPTFLYVYCSEIHTIVLWCSQQTNVVTK